MTNSVQLIVSPNQSFLTDQGIVNEGGLIWTYDFENLSSPKATYSDSGLTDLLPNPLELNAYGRLQSDVWYDSTTTTAITLKVLDKYSVATTPSVYNLPAGNIQTTAFITDDDSSNITTYPVWVKSTSGQQPEYVSADSLTFNPSTGILSATAFSGEFLTELSDQTDTTYTLALFDSGTIITFTNASDITVTIPTNASVQFPIGSQIELLQGGAGNVIFSPAVGVTMNSKFGNTSLVNQFSGATLVKTDTDTWILVGDLAAGVGNVTQTDLTNAINGAEAMMIGIGQIPTDVKSTRNTNTVYQNTTTRPILVSVAFGPVSSGSVPPVGLYASTAPGGPFTEIASDSSGGAGGVGAGFCGIVPPNYYYRVQGTYSQVYMWNELR